MSAYPVLPSQKLNGTIRRRNQRGDAVSLYRMRTLDGSHHGRPLAQAIIVALGWPLQRSPDGRIEQHGELLADREPLLRRQSAGYFRGPRARKDLEHSDLYFRTGRAQILFQQGACA